MLTSLLVSAIQRGNRVLIRLSISWEQRAVREPQAFVMGSKEILGKDLSNVQGRKYPNKTICLILVGAETQDSHLRGPGMFNIGVCSQDNVDF